MLLDTLRQINNSSVFSKQSLAKELNTSEEMVDVFIKQLIDMGYLEKYIQEPNCSGNCSGCSIPCKQQNLGNTFIITEKGKKLLQ